MEKKLTLQYDREGDILYIESATTPASMGEGGVFASARWHTQGRPIVYLAESPAGALIEALVHLELARAHFPKSYRLLKVNAPDDLPIAMITTENLPKNWVHDPIVTRTAGDNWQPVEIPIFIRSYPFFPLSPGE